MDNIKVVIYVLIEDIKFINDEVYLHKSIEMSLSECIKQISKIHYEAYYNHYRHENDYDVENTQFPPIIYAFYSFVFYKNKIPSPEELINNYFVLYAEQIIAEGEEVKYNNKKYKKCALIARILRTYPSLIRDFHFYLLLVNEKCFDKVIYSCKTDIEGKDIIIKHKGDIYQVSLFVDTKRSKSFKKIKNNIRHEYNNEIAIPIKFELAERCGDFYVYGQKDLEKIKKHIYSNQEGLL